MRLAHPAALTAMLCLSLGAQQVPAARAELTLDLHALNEEEAARQNINVDPCPVKLSRTRPEAIRKAPPCQGSPLYGSLKIGNGPRATTWFLLDEKAHKIYVDRNQDGDLTASAPQDTRGGVGFPLSWEIEGKVEHGQFFIFMWKVPGEAELYYRSETARKGRITLGGRTYDVLLQDSGGLAQFDSRAEARTKRSRAWFKIDLNRDGLFTNEELLECTLMGEDLPIGPKRYRPEASLDGRFVELFEVASKAR